MKNKLLILCPGRQTYLVSLFEKYFDVYIGDNAQTTLDTYYNLPSVKMPRYDSESYLSILTDYIQKNSIEFLVTLSDVEVVLLTKNESVFTRLNCKLIALPYDMAYACLDKYLFAQVLSKNNIDTPKTYIKPNEVLSDIERRILKLPIIVKNRWGMGSRGLKVIKTMEELSDCISNISTVKAPSFLGNVSDAEYSLVFQELIPGQEYGIDVVNDINHQYYTHLLKKKIEMRGGETDIAQITELEEAKELAVKISSTFKHIGNLDCDFIYVDKRCYVIDINPRFGGGYMFSSYTGLNVPELLSKWINKEEVLEFTPMNIGKIYRKITNLIEIK